MEVVDTVKDRSGLAEDLLVDTKQSREERGRLQLFAALPAIRSCPLDRKPGSVSFLRRSDHDFAVVSFDHEGVDVVTDLCREVEQAEDTGRLQHEYTATLVWPLCDNQLEVPISRCLQRHNYEN